MSLTRTITDPSQLFHDLKAMDRKDNFSYEGAKALQAYMEELAEDCGMNIEYDPVAFCCEYSEYDSAVNCIECCQYDCDFEDIEDDDKEDHALEYLRDHTQVIEFQGGIIIADY